MKLFRLSALCVALLLAGTANAFAYVDPGTAGMLYQVGYALVLAVIGWFAGLRYVFARLFSRKAKSEEAD